MQQVWIAFQVSAAVLLLQLVQTRIFSYLFWNHLVYFIISIALLGFGISGTWLTLVNQNRFERFLSLKKAAWGFMLSSFSSCFISSVISIDTTQTVELGSKILPLLLTYGVAILPYFFAGWILGKLFRDHSTKIHRLYGATFLGAGVGCVLFLFFVANLGAIQLLGLSCLLATVPTVFEKRALLKNSVSLFAIAAFGVLVVAYETNLNQQLRPEESKGVPQFDVLVGPGDKKIIEWSEWNSIARIDVLSPQNHPDTKYIFVDGDSWTRIAKKVGPSPTPRSRRSDDSQFLTSLPYTIRKNARSALIIGVGGGNDVSQAVEFEVNDVDAVEINSTISELLSSKYSTFNQGLFSGPTVSLHTEEGRSFVRRGKKQYDVIMIHNMDTFAALNAGAYILADSYLYTLEAFTDYISRLSDRGILCFTRGFVEKDAFRIFTTAMEALRTLGKEMPERHIAIVTHELWTSILVSNKPFSINELDNLHAGDLGDVYYVGKDESKAPLQILIDGYSSHLTNFERASFLRRLSYDATPTYDDAPFFRQQKRWTSMLDVFQLKNRTEWASGSWPYFTLWILALTALMAVCIFIFLPLLRYHGRDSLRGALPWSLYFLSLGIAYICVELSLLQRFALLLGHPSRSLAIVLTSLLLGSGLGSLLSVRCRNRTVLLYSFLIGGILSAAYLYPLLDQAALALPLMYRTGIVIGLVLPIGVVMGMPFPIGMEAIGKIRKEAVPWMWGINGGTTVLGSILAVGLAMKCGFTAVLLLAAFAYMIAAVTFIFLGGFSGRGGSIRGRKN